MKRSVLLLAVLSLMFVPAIASAQQRSEISLNAFGAFTNQSGSGSLDRTATTSGGGLLTYDFFPGAHGGIEANYSYTKNSQKYTNAFGAVIPPVQTHIQELTGAWVLRAERGAFRPFALVGGGFVILRPSDTAVDNAPLPISRQTHAAFLFGAGVDVQMRQKLALRLQYRGLIYQAPDFGNASIHTGSAMRTMEPSLGLVYRF